MPNINVSLTAAECIVVALQASIAANNAALVEVRGALAEEQRQADLRAQALALAQKQLQEKADELKKGNGAAGVPLLRAVPAESHIDMPHVDAGGGSGDLDES